MKTIHHVFDTTAPRDTVFAALTTAQGLSGWWTTIVKAEAGVGAIAHFTFAGDFNLDMRVAALEPGMRRLITGSFLRIRLLAYEGH